MGSRLPSRSRQPPIRRSRVFDRLCSPSPARFSPCDGNLPPSASSLQPTSNSARLNMQQDQPFPVLHASAPFASPRWTGATAAVAFAPDERSSGCPHDKCAIFSPTASCPRCIGVLYRCTTCEVSRFVGHSLLGRDYSKDPKDHAAGSVICSPCRFCPDQPSRLQEACSEGLLHSLT
jgi:hypothetical protein